MATNEGFALADTVAITATTSRKFGAAIQIEAPHWTLAFDYAKGPEAGITDVLLELAQDQAFTLPFPAHEIAANARVDLMNITAPTASQVWCHLGGIYADGSGNAVAHLPVGAWARVTVGPNGALGDGSGTLGVYLAQSWLNQDQTQRNR